MEKKVLQVRLPAELHARLSGVKGVRSLNAEIVERLERSFDSADMVAVNAAWPKPDAMSKRAGFSVAFPESTGKLIVDVSPAAPLSAGSPGIVGTPRSSRFESERPRAGRRTMMCAHRVPVTAFCARCD